MFGFYTDEELEAGNNLEFKLLGISRRYYNYMNPEELEPMLRTAGRWSSLELKTGRGKGYDGTETGWVEALARKSADAG